MRHVEVDGLCDALGAGRGDLVSLVGSGGKTTLMYRLLRELRARGVAAVAATTTKIGVPGPEGPELLCAEAWEELVERLAAAPPGARVLGRRVLTGGKVEGIPPEWCDRLLAEGVVEALVVEADGSARKPLKAPEAWEPVVPAATTVFVAVVGLACLARPLGPEVAFRPERVAAAASLAPGAAVTVEALARLFASPEGMLKGRPAGARAVAVLNQADLPGALEGGWEAARLLLTADGPYGRALVVSLREEAPILEVWGP